MASMITFINSLFYKITNFALGQTTLFIIILGWFFVITGLIFLARPEAARTNLVKRGFGTLKGLLIIALLYLLVFAFSLAGKIGGPLSAMISVAAIVGAVWAFFYLTKKTLQVITDKLSLVPVPALKTYAAIQVIIGALMIALHRRIW